MNDSQLPESVPPSEPAEESAPPAPVTLAAEDIFQGAREVIIEHDGKQYLLRITRRHKLILTRA